MTIQEPPPRSREQRRQDTLVRLTEDIDAWVATASEGRAFLMPLSFTWHEGTLLMCTRRANPAARNVTPRGRVVVTLGQTRDVIHIEGEAEVVEGSALDKASADAFAAKMAWDPRSRQSWVYLRITPLVVKAWREVNELKERLIMQDGHWLD